MIKLFLADDHPFVLSGIEAGLEGSNYSVVGTAPNGAALLDALASFRPDIIVMDLQMPERDGVEVLRTLRTRGDMRPVVILAASLSDAKLLEAIRLGVNGIVLKDGGRAVLLECLDSVVAGRKWIEQSLLQRAVELSVEGQDQRSPIARLTRRERAIVTLVSHGRRNRDIAEEIGMSEGSVKVYLHRIYEKLDVSNRTELAVMASNSGFSGPANG